MDRVSRATLQFAYFSAIFVAVAILALLIFLPYLPTVAVSAVFAYIFYPLYRRVRRVFRYETLSALSTALLALLIVLVPLSFFGSLLFREVSGSYASLGAGAGYLPHIVAAIDSKLAELFPGVQFNSEEYIRGALGQFASGIGGFFASAVEISAKIFIGIVAFYYFLRDGARVVSSIKRFSPLSQDDTGLLVNKVGESITSIIRGSLVMALAQGIAAGLGYYLVGLPNPILWGVATMFSALVPGIGIGLIVIPAALYLIAVGATINGIILLAWGLLGVGTLDNILRPYLIGRGMHIHPFLILLSIFAGLAFFGASGLILGPAVLSFFIALLAVYPKLIGSVSH